MSISMYSASVPIFTKILSNMLVWFDKAEADATARKYDVNVLLAARFAPDMLPFTAQIRIACDAAKNGAARLAVVQPPKFEDNEATMPELRARVQKTIDFIGTLQASQMDGGEAREVTMPTQNGSITLPGEPYLKTIVLPNFFFHSTMTYALLRHSGVPLGKMDFLNGGPLG